MSLECIYCEHKGRYVNLHVYMHGPICEFASSCEICNGREICEYADDVLEEEEEEEY